MIYKLIFFILLFFGNLNLLAQTSDSIIFRLKKINVGIEFGRSQYRLSENAENNNSSIKAKLLPYINFTIGYNLFLKKHNYIIPKLGYEFEFSNFKYQYNEVESFNGVNTIGTQTVSFIGYKNNKYSQVNIKNSSSVNISAAYLRLFDLFRSNNIMFCATGAVSLKYKTFIYSKVEYNYSKDSLGTTIDSYNYGYIDSGFNTKTNDLYFYSHFGIGFLSKGKKIQHQLFLKLATRLNNCYAEDAYIKKSLLRITYNLNF